MTKFDSGNFHSHPLVQQFTNIVYVDSHEEFLLLLEEKLVEISNKISASSKKKSVIVNYEELLKFGQSHVTTPKEFKRYKDLLEKTLEDDISTQISHMLEEAGFLSSHEPDHNGHVDLLVQSQNKKFKWLGEAKLYDGNKYHQKGLYQLIDDYSLGTQNESGGVLIYLNSTQYTVKEVMLSWEAYLKELSKDPLNRLKNFSSEFKEGTSAIFYSNHEHHRSGDPYRIRHCCLDIRINF